MNKLTPAMTALIAATAVTGATLIAATPASALTYKCTTSTKSIDDPAYSGPWSDNWDFTVTVCAARSGSVIYSYSKISWDGPAGTYPADDTSIFDRAYFKQQIKKSVSGPDPVLKTAYYYGIESRLENSSGDWANYNGSYTTGTVSYTIGSSKGRSDGVLKLDWDNDGAGTKSYYFSASPIV